MKKFILLLIVLLPLATFAQIYIEMGGGAEYLQNGVATGEDNAGKETGIKNVFPVMKLAVGAEFNNSIVVETVLQAGITRTKNVGAYFGFKGGYNFGNIVPAVGFYYGYLDADNTDKNAGHVGYSLRYQKFVNEQAGLFVEGLYINKTAQLTAGIHFAF